MFGRDYSYIEEQLTRDDAGPRPFDQKMYAVSLLAKLLDRAKVLDIALRSVEHGELNQADIQSAIWIFTEDCDEVRMRAYRAGILDDAHDAHLARSWIESDNVGMDVLCNPPRLPIADEIDEARRAAAREQVYGKAEQARPRLVHADPHGERGA